MDSKAIRKHIQQFLKENYDDISYWSDFDRNEFGGDAMRAAMSDMKDDGMDVEPLGKSRFEKDLDVEEMIQDLENAKLGLPSDSKQLKAIQKKIDHLERLGAGSLNETNEFFDPYEFDTPAIKEHDIVFIVTAVDNFKAGTRGTVIHEYPGKDVVEVEFVDDKGKNIGTATVNKDNLRKTEYKTALEKQQKEKEKRREIHYNPTTLLKQFNKNQSPNNDELKEYMSPDAFSTKEYGQILPDKQIDLYYNRVADDLANGRDTKDIVRTLVRLNGGKLPPTVQTLFDNAQNMYENEEVNPDAVDTTNLYKFLKDAIHQMTSKGFSEEKIAMTLETILNKHFNISKKGAFNMNEMFTGTDYELYADDVEPFLKKGINYSYTDFGKAFAQTNNAALHSLDMNSIIDVLIGRGYSVEKYVGESSAISQTIKKGTNAKPNGPAHTILSQEGDGVSMTIKKGMNIKPKNK